MAVLTNKRWREGSDFERKAFLLGAWAISSNMSPGKFPDEFISTLFVEENNEDGVLWKIFSNAASNKHEEKTRLLAFRICCNSLIDALSLSRTLGRSGDQYETNIARLTAKANSLIWFLLSLHISKDVVVPQDVAEQYPEFFSGKMKKGEEHDDVEM